MFDCMIVSFWETWYKRIKEQDVDTKKSMGHFTDWKFGVPVRVLRQSGGSFYVEGNLIHETNIEFTMINNAGGVMAVSKANYYYELIPYICSGGKPRYPVCITPEETAYCNCAGRVITSLGTTCMPITVMPQPTATLIIDDKEIKLSAETVARLKKELGV